jgi:hypothetical protein
MVLADHQVPKGVSLYKLLRIQKHSFKKLYIKFRKTVYIYFQCKMLVLLNVQKGSERLLTVRNLRNVLYCAIHIKCTLYLADIHRDAQSDVEQIGEALSTGGQIYSRAVDKGRPSVLQGKPFSYYAIRFRPKNVHWSQIR